MKIYELIDIGHQHELKLWNVRNFMIMAVCDTPKKIEGKELYEIIIDDDDVLKFVGDCYVDKCVYNDLRELFEETDPFGEPNA